MQKEENLTESALKNEGLKVRLNQIIGYLMQKDPDKYKNQNKISTSLNIQRSNLSAAINGDERYLKLDSPVIKTILSNFPEISKNWFATGTGTMLYENEIKSNGISKEEFETLPIGKQLSLMWEILLEMKTELDLKVVKQDEKIIKIVDFIEAKITPMYDFIEMNLKK